MAAATPGSIERVGSFSDTPPWRLPAHDLSWQRSIDLRRMVARRRVPALVQPRRLPPGPRVVKVAWEWGKA
ncbi:MAG: hypothetical protein ACC660_06650, partial [Acidimicrobiales bacterium]